MDDHPRMPDDDPVNDPARRRAIGSLAGGIAAVGMAGAASGQTATATPPASPPAASAASAGAATAPPLRNPVDLYPKPPFPEQTQPWPGLQSQMTPRPDSGEDSYIGTGRLRGRRALITGGDSGIGRAAAIAFAREGADVAINYHPDEEPDAQEVVALIEAEGRKAAAIPGDLTDAAFCRELVDRALAELGGLDILVNNAGYQQTKKTLDEITDEQFERTFRTNVFAPFFITKAALPHMPPGAAIIITASVQGVNPAGELFDYAQTKAANIAYAKSLAKQLAPRGIRVNAVAPGPFWTPLQVSGGQIPSKLPQFGSDSPMGRPGQPVEIAPLYVALAAADNTYASGQLYGSSGGSGQD